MAKLTLVFSRNHSIGEFVIRLVTWSSWGHVGVVVPGEYSDMVIDARPFVGVRETTLGEFLNRSTKYAFKEVEVEDVEAGIEWTRQQIGKKYDMIGVLGLGLNREWDQEDKWFCSELSEGAIKAAGRSRFSSQTKRITPQLCWMVA